MANNSIVNECSGCVLPSYEEAVKFEDRKSRIQTLESGDSGVPQSDDLGTVVCVSHDSVIVSDGDRLVSVDGQFADSVDASEAGIDWIGSSFSSKSIRLLFMRKVFLVLICQLLITIGVVCLFLFCQPVRDWIRGPQNFWFYYAAYGIFVITYIVLVCCKSVRRQWPGNLICLTVFTLSLSCLAGTISSFHNTLFVLIAFAMVIVICLGLTLFALQTKIDFTLCSGMLFAFAMTVCVFGIYCIVTATLAEFSSSLVLTGVWSGLVALLFSLFLVFDIQLVVGGNSIELSPEEYVYGALHIYLDVIILFLMIVGCSGRS